MMDLARRLRVHLLFYKAKMRGFSDRQIAQLVTTPDDAGRNQGVFGPWAWRRNGEHMFL